MSQIPSQFRRRDRFRKRLDRNRNFNFLASVPQCPNLMSSQHNLDSKVPPLGQNLWFDAFQKLSVEDQERLQKIQPMQGAVSNGIDELIAKTKEKQIECEKKSYKFSFQGKDIILRDVAEKIVFWLNKFKEIGDVAVNFDPVHSSLSWAGIRFCLQAAVSEHQQMGVLLISMEKVTYLASRCKIYENLYKPETTSKEALQNLHSGLIELYIAILRVLSHSHRIFTHNKAKRIGHALINPNKMSDFFTTIQGLENRVEIEAQNCERERSQKADENAQALLQKLHEPLFRLDTRVLSLMERIDDKERLAILDWVSSILHGNNHDTVKYQRTKGTCDWLLRHNRYREWQSESSSTILWLHGTPGTGKTYITSRVIDEIRDALRTNLNHESLAFFYCNRNENERRKPLSVLRSFVRQLSTVAHDKSSIQMRLKEYYLTSRLNCSEPTLNDCKNLLLEYINIYPRTTLILDALDECDKHERGQLMEIFDYLLAHALKPLKIFISSRPDGDIKERFSNGANIPIQATDNHEDISKFIQSEIIKHQRWNKMSDELREEIISTLHIQSQGMFQWAKLQIKQLLELSQAKHIRDRLGKLPKDLKQTYDEICQSMTQEERKIAYRAFRWIMCSCEPLPTHVLLPAICQDEEDDTAQEVEDLDGDLLLEYCHHLLIIDPIRQVWIPSHLSVVEYFENYLWSQVEANCLVSTVCLLVLNSTSLYSEDDVKKMKSRDFRWREKEEKNIVPDHWALWNLTVYAGNFWMDHVRKSQGEDMNNGYPMNNRLPSLLKKFLGSPKDSSRAYRIWHETISKTSYGNLPTSSIFLHSLIRPHDLNPSSMTTFPICCFGFDTIISDWWDNAGLEFAQKSTNELSLLQLAIYGSSPPICRRLIGWGVDVNEHQDHKDSALARASMLGYIEIVALLIEAGAEVNMVLQNWNYASALIAAVANNKIETVKLLLEAGAKVNMQYQRGHDGSALEAAVIRSGQVSTKGIVKLLLESGADVNMQLQTGLYGSALVSAIVSSEPKIVELLLEAGAEVNMQPQLGEYRSALVAASSVHFKPEILKLLLEAGADVDMELKSSTYGSALIAAVATVKYHDGNTRNVRLLLEAGADVNLQVRTGQCENALEAAQKLKHSWQDDMMKLLREYGLKEVPKVFEEFEESKEPNIS